MSIKNYQFFCLLYTSFSSSDQEIPSFSTRFKTRFTVFFGYPFKQTVHYTVGDNKRNGIKVNHDLYVASKDFKIEVKYLKNWKSTSGNNSASKTWAEYQKDFDWLIEEIKKRL